MPDQGYDVGGDRNMMPNRDEIQRVLDICTALNRAGSSLDHKSRVWHEVLKPLLAEVVGPKSGNESASLKSRETQVLVEALLTHQLYSEL
jgi:hypothetical protein